MSFSAKNTAFISKHFLALSVLLIIAAGFMVYGNSIGGKFIWDDNYLIRNNAYIKDPGGLARLFAGSIGMGSGKESDFYRPFQLLTYAIDYSVFTLDARGYHVTNILLHILTGLCVYWLAGLLYGDRLLSFLAGILFVVHPVHTEAVSYISGRADILAGLFTILALIFYLRYVHSGRIRLCVITLAAYGCALLSKESSLIIPAVILWWHYAFKEKPRTGCFLLVAATTIVYVVIRSAALHFHALAAGGTPPLAVRIPGVFAAIATYVRLLVLPLNLHMEYIDRGFRFSDPIVAAGIFISLISLLYLFNKKRDDAVAFFSTGWFFITLFPHSNIYPINAYMAEHWLYVPSIGFFLVVAHWCASLFRKNHLYGLLIAVFVAGCSYLTVQQNGYWSESIGFYERTLRYAPGSARVYYNLGNEYGDAGKKEKAIAAFRKAITINPAYTDAYYNLGNMYRDIDKKDDAIAMYKKAIGLDPRNARYYNNMGSVYGSMGRSEEAVALFKKAVALDPGHAKAYCNIGVVYRSAGRDEEAADEFNKALAIDPSCVEAHYNLALLYAGRKKYGQAAEHFQKMEELGFTDAALSKVLAPYRIKSRMHR